MSEECPIPDSDWQRFVAQGDQDAFGRVVRNYYGLVHSVCRRTLERYPSAVEDAVQETFCKLAVNAKSIRTNLASWLHTCALNSSRELIRKEQSRRQRETKWARQREERFSCQEVERIDDLDAAIQALSPSDRMLVTEHFLVGRSQTELAGLLGVTPSAVSKRLTKALESLRGKLAQLGVTVTISSLASALATGKAEAATTLDSVSEISDSALSESGRSLALRTWLPAVGSWPAQVAALSGLVAVVAVVGVVAAWYWVGKATPRIIASGPLNVVGGHIADSFGMAMASDGPHLLIGAPLDKTADVAAGAVYAFHNGGSGWQQTQKITPPDGSGTTFGGTIAIDGDTAALGALGHWFLRGAAKYDMDTPMPAPRVSAVEIHNHISGQWRHTQTLPAPTNSDGFGSEIALNGEHLLIGDWYDDDQGENSGAVYSYRRVGNQWTPIGKLTPPSHQPFSGFGHKIAVGPDCLAVAASGDSEQGKGAGAVYILEFANGEWQHRFKLTASDGQSGRGFGQSITMDGDYMAVGAASQAATKKGPGRVYLFRNHSGRWREEEVLCPTELANGSQFGFDVDLRGGVLVVCARFAQSSVGPGTGAAYVFNRRWGKWKQARVLRPTSAEPHMAFADAATVCDGGLCVGCSGGYSKVFKVSSEDHANRLIKKLTSGKLPTITEIRDKPGRAFMYEIAD